MALGCKTTVTILWRNFNENTEKRNLGLSRLCSATFEQLFAVLATLRNFCLSEQLLSKI